MSAADRSETEIGSLDTSLWDADLAAGMPVLCTPAVAVPEHVITQAETLELARRLHADHPQAQLVLRLIENTGVAKRHLIRPIEETLVHTGFGHRNQVFEAEAKKRIPAVVDDALANAGLKREDIGAIVLVSCTGFMMPSLTAWMINELGFRTNTAQLPIAQLGCAAGTAAINRASDFCGARPVPTPSSSPASSARCAISRRPRCGQPAVERPVRRRDRRRGRAR